MTATTMHFGPEWMRTKQPPRTQPQPSEPITPSPSGASSYSALVSPAPAVQTEKRDEAHPFRYSKEELLRIYKEGGGRGGLGLEVERWEGVVREVGSEPIGLRETTEAEKKLFAGPLNSELRRRQSNDFLSPLPSTSVGGERTRTNHNNSAAVSPLRERFGSLMRRKDGADQPSLTIPRRSSLSSGPGPLTSPRDSAQSSPRTRMPFTPSFDGILNSGDSWVARRRVSEGMQKSAVVKGDAGGGEGQQDSKEADIKEEEEEEGRKETDRIPIVPDGSQNVRRPESPPQPEPPQSPPSDPPSNESPEVQVASSGSRKASSTTETSVDSARAINTAPALQDLTSVEWSYLDPQGQVQGPFRADLMQKWHDEGYFTPDLLMKRTHIDTEWLPVGELARRSGGDKIFLSFPAAPVPPGLSRPSDTPLQGFTHRTEQNTFNGSYQPAPVRSLRTSTLDSYIGSSSNPSDSPSSSFGGGGFGNGSPDQAAFDGLVANNHYSAVDSSNNARATGYSATPDSTPAFSGVRRNASHDPLVDPSHGIRSSSFNNMTLSRTAAVDAYGFNGSYGSPQQPWPMPSPNPANPNFDGRISNRSIMEQGQLPSSFGPSSTPAMPLPHQTGYGANRGVQEASFGDSSSGVFSGPDFAIGDFGNQRSTMEAEIPTTAGFNNYVDGHGNPSQGQSFAPSSSAQYSVPQSMPTLSNRFGQHGTTSIIIPSNQPMVNPNTLHSSTSSIPPQSPWNPHEPTTVRRPGPFDPMHPTSANTIVNAPVNPQPQSWSRANTAPHPVPLPNEPSPWFTAPQGAVDEGWKEISGPSSLTFHNVGQHNQPPQESTAPDGANTQETSNQHFQPPPAPEPVVVPAPAPAKPRRKSSNQSSQNQVPSSSKSTSLPSATLKSPSPPPIAQHKSAWLGEGGEKKNQSSGNSLNLREIQDAEAKKAEARKAAEKERERIVRAPAPLSDANDLSSFTGSWGLPTSQAGAARSNAVPKDVHVTSTSSPVLPAQTPAVWTTGNAQPAKKSMKEIQEEEERRKKMAVKEPAAAAVRRAHAESTNRPTISSASHSGVWTTVGPSGKVPATVVAPARTTLASSASVPNLSASTSASRTNGMTPRSPAGQSAKATPTAAPRADDSPAPPSLDFLKWLSDSLKGLNNSVNVEEIMSMLMSFPMDPDPSTIEIISDLIYANSITLDGRRFAAEFVSKRKVDVASRPKGAGVSGTPAKPVSIADVVKAQPKATQPEWGGFKVVNKKKKGGRA